MLSRKLKIYLLVGFLILSFVLLLILLLARRPGQLPPEEGPTPTAIQTSPAEGEVTIPEKIEPTFTGVLEEEIPKEEQEKINQAFELRQRLPIKTSQFELDYDYENDNFVVKIAEPFAENRQKFGQWLIDNGFDKIPEDRFVFKKF